jgi:outer membrane lipoprotein SlyB
MRNDPDTMPSLRMTPFAMALISSTVLCACAAPHRDEPGGVPSPAERVQWLAYGVVESIQMLSQEEALAASATVRVGVRLEDGRLYSLMQESADGLHPGQRVKVENGRVRAANHSPE